MIGAHVPAGKASTAAELLRIGVIQVHYGTPRQWMVNMNHKGVDLTPEVRTYVHAPYLINFSSSDDRKRNLSIACMKAQLEFCEGQDIEGLVIHGGSYKGQTLDECCEQWRFYMNHFTSQYSTKILVENAASGRYSPTCEFAKFDRLWRFIGGIEGVGVCLDTCHVWASGQVPSMFAERFKELVGHVDLVHANGAKMEFGSKQDRHSPYHSSKLSLSMILEMIYQVDPTDIIVESSDPDYDVRELELAFKPSMYMKHISKEERGRRFLP